MNHGYGAIDTVRESENSTVINAWSLDLTYPPQGCGPHATYRSQALLQDSCVLGGTGDGDGIVDAGESTRFSVSIENDGTVPLSGLTATVTPITPGVTMSSNMAAFGNIPADGIAASQGASFTARLPGNLGCGSHVDYQIAIGGNEGSWTTNFSTIVGQPFAGGGTALSESFSQGIPPDWTVVDGGNDGGVAATWTTDNPGLRTFVSPISAPAAIVDSDRAGPAANQDEQLITPVLNLSVATNVVLNFDQWFAWFSSNRNEKGDVDVRSTRTGNAWVNVFRNVLGSSPNPNHKTLNITAQAAGASNVQIRFRYFQANFEKWWIVDNVLVTYDSPAGCNTTPCALPSPPPVPDGTFGTPLRATRQNPAGTAIGLIWDTSTCAAEDYHLLYGPLVSVSSHAIAGSVCALGTAGTFTWTGVPSGDLWYLVVSSDGAGLEGTWGTTSAGADIQGTTPSGQCGNTARSNAGSCP